MVVMQIRHAYHATAPARLALVYKAMNANLVITPISFITLQPRPAQIVFRDNLEMIL